MTKSKKRNKEKAEEIIRWLYDLDKEHEIGAGRYRTATDKIVHALAEERERCADRGREEARKHDFTNRCVMQHFGAFCADEVARAIREGDKEREETRNNL